MKKVSLVFILSFSYFISNAQVKDSTIRTHNARKATLYSTFLPGLGQLYNKKYWKTPIVWGSIAYLGFQIHQRNVLYKQYGDAYTIKVTGNGTDPYPSFSPSIIKQYRDNARKSRDFFVLITALVWGLNIVDAQVDGQLYNFDVNKRLTLKPYSEYNPLLNSTLFGVTSTLKF